MLTGSLDRLAMPDSLLVWPFFETSCALVPKLKQWNPGESSVNELEHAVIQPFLE